MAHGGKEGALRRVGLFGGGAGVLRLAEQAHVLDGDHGLIAEAARDVDLVVRVGARRLAGKGQNADTVTRRSSSGTSGWSDTPYRS